MPSLEYDYTFEKGVKAGDRLLELICEIDPRARAKCEVFTPEGTPNELYAEIWERSEYKRPLKCVEGFLSRVLKPTNLDGQIIALWGADKLLEDQSRVAPICEIPRSAGFLQLGDWTGQSDGDGWCLDINWGCIRCVNVGSGSKDIDQVRLASYGVFDSLWQWVAYLRCSAWERGWIEKS